MDYQTYSVFFSSPILEERTLVVTSTNSYSQYSFSFYLIIIIYEYVLSMYVISKANSPIRNTIFQYGKQTIKILSTSSVAAVGYSHAPLEPNTVSNFVHTKTPFGRGYDYEIGSFNLKVKGDAVSCALGNKDMINAVQKHAPDSGIIDVNKLNNIVNDPEFKSKISVNTSFAEKTFIGIPLIDLSSYTISNPVDSDISDSNSLENLSETNDDDNNTDENTTPVTKKPSLRKHYSEPLPQKSNSPAIQRRNTG